MGQTQQKYSQFPNIHSNPTKMATTMKSQLTVARTSTGLANSRMNGRVLSAPKLRAQSRKSLVVRAEEPSTSEPVPAAAAETMAPKEPFAMNFNGFAPETINGRLAQVGFVAGVGAEIGSGESFATQFHDHPVAFLLASSLITLATFMPTLQSSTEYNSNPASMQSAKSGLFNVDAEKLNGRAAMLGIVAILATEAIKGSALF